MNSKNGNIKEPACTFAFQLRIVLKQGDVKHERKAGHVIDLIIRFGIIHQ